HAVAVRIGLVQPSPANHVPDDRHATRGRADVDAYATRGVDGVAGDRDVVAARLDADFEATGHRVPGDRDAIAVFVRVDPRVERVGDGVAGDGHGADDAVVRGRAGVRRVERDPVTAAPDRVAGERDVSRAAVDRYAVPEDAVAFVATEVVD